MSSVLAGDSLVTRDRRLYQRLVPSLPPLVLLDKSKYSLLVDLCEGGLAVGGFIPENRDHVISLEFDMPDGSGCIQTQAEIVWASDSGHRTGFRFVDLQDNLRLLLKAWVSTTSAARMAAIDSGLARPTFGTGTEAIQTSSRSIEGRVSERDKSENSEIPVPQPGTLNLGISFPKENEGLNALQLVSIVVMAVVISSTIAFLLGYYWRGRQQRRVTPIAAAARPSEHSTGGSIAPAPQLSPQTAIPSVLPLDNSGLVLQVGAMAEEASADALCNDLRKKNFSAFVFRRGSNDIYRVAVGPYADEGAAASIQNDLEKQGYNPIVKPWSPE
jgi:hypothetical protein